MATGPKVARSPLELLSNESSREPPFINKYWGAGICGGLAFIGVCMGNYFTKRPMFSGLQKHVGFTVGGGFLGNYIDHRRSDYLAERDAVFRHYVELHPEDFPPYERKKYADVLEPWTPIR